jgi:hypothetical protein
MRWISSLVCALVACGGDDMTEMEPDLLVVGPDGIVIEHTATSIVMAEYRIDGAFSPARDVVWGSSDAAVATIAGDGAQATITAVAPGTSVVTAIGRNSLVGVTEVRVAPP